MRTFVVYIYNKRLFFTDPKYFVRKCARMHQMRNTAKKFDWTVFNFAHFFVIQVYSCAESLKNDENWAFTDNRAQMRTNVYLPLKKCPFIARTSFVRKCARMNNEVDYEHVVTNFKI